MNRILADIGYLHSSGLINRTHSPDDTGLKIEGRGIDLINKFLEEFPDYLKRSSNS